jgi:hypothetical protein
VVGVSDPFAHSPGRTPLYDEGGRLVLVFSAVEDARDNRPWADGAWRPSSAPLAVTCQAVLEALPGYTLSTSDEALAEGLCQAGAEEVRHAHSMSHSLRELRCLSGRTQRPQP